MASAAPSNGSQPKVDKAKVIFDAITGSASLWCSTDDIAYATFLDNGVHQTWPVRSKPFNGLMAAIAWRHSLGLLGAQMRDSLLVLIERAAAQQPRRETALRCRQVGQKLYLNMADPDWSTVECSGAGWSVTAGMPNWLPFVRSQTMAPFPMPLAGGSLDLLRNYVNVRSDDDFKLLVGFILAALRDSREYPVLVINGAQGSAKTTTTNFISQLVDPSFDTASKLPDSVRDLGVMARNRHLLAFDNLSFLHPRMSDAICQIATGLTINERAYYTNGDIFSYRVYRPVILNGIPQMVDRDDLGRRMFSITLESVRNADKIPIDVLQAQFDLEKPLIWGAILDALCVAIANYASTSRPSTDGLVSVAQFVEAAAPALGWAPGEFTSIYNANRAIAVDSILDGDDFARLTLDCLARDGIFSGDYEHFLQMTAEFRRPGKQEYFPLDSKRWIERLKRLAPALRLRGIALHGLDPIDGKEWRDPKSRRRIVEIKEHR